MSNFRYRKWLYQTVCRQQKPVKEPFTFFKTVVGCVAYVITVGLAFFLCSDLQHAFRIVPLDVIS